MLFRKYTFAYHHHYNGTCKTILESLYELFGYITAFYLYFTLSSRSEWHTIELIVRVLLATPLVVIVLFVILRRCSNLKSSVTKFRLRRVPVNIEPTQSSKIDTPRASRSMKQPTFTILGYGTMS